MGGWPGTHTHLEHFYFLQHKFFHLLVILGQHNDLLHCPAVWNRPGRASVGLRMRGKGTNLSPFPHQGPHPEGQQSKNLGLRVMCPPFGSPTQTLARGAVEEQNGVLSSWNQEGAGINEWPDLRTQERAPTISPAQIRVPSTQGP